MLDSFALLKIWSWSQWWIFFCIFQSNISTSEGGDHMWWLLKKNVEFDIQLYSNALKGSFSVIYHWNGIQRVKVPRRVSFFIWTVAWGKIFTGGNLRRGLSIVEWCCMCQCSGEIVDHLLLHCETEYQLWCIVFNSFEISWVLPRRVIGLLFG